MRQLKHIEKDIYYCDNTGKYFKYNHKNKLYQWYYFPHSKTKRLCGVYYIYDRIHNKYYIGSSVDIIDRITKHRSSFNSNSDKHTMYLSSLCHGDKYVEFGLLELCDKEHLSELERYYIRLADSVSNGWNKSYNTSDTWLRKRDWSTNFYYGTKRETYLC